MKKPWRYHGECCASGGPAAKTLGACGPSGFGLGTSLGTTFTMVPPQLFQIMSQYAVCSVQCTVRSVCSVQCVQREVCEECVVCNVPCAVCNVQ